MHSNWSQKQTVAAVCEKKTIHTEVGKGGPYGDTEQEGSYGEYGGGTYGGGGGGNTRRMICSLRQKMTTQTALATSPATLASNEEKKSTDTHARTSGQVGGGKACSTPRGSTTTCTKRCLSQCCRSWAHRCDNTGRFEREREENENKDTGATETPTKRGAEGVTSAQTSSDRFTLMATSSLQ